MDPISLIKEARELMENTHSYDSEIARKIDATLDGLKEGKVYAETFYTNLLYDALYLFEHINCEETEIYQKLDKYLEGK